MNNEKEEYLFIATGIMDQWKYGVTLRSSIPSNGILSCVLDSNVFPPFASHKFTKEDIIKIRDYLNEYLNRTDTKP